MVKMSVARVILTPQWIYLTINIEIILLHRRHPSRQVGILLLKLFIPPLLIHISEWWCGHPFVCSIWACLPSLKHHSYFTSVARNRVKEVA